MYVFRWRSTLTSRRPSSLASWTSAAATKNRMSSGFEKSESTATFVPTPSIMNMLNLGVKRSTPQWNSCRYLEVYFVSGRTLKFSFTNAKARFFRAFNAMYSKVGRAASEETILELLGSKCLPVLLYATEMCVMLSRDKQSLEFTLTRFKSFVHENFSHQFSHCGDRMPT